MRTPEQPRHHRGGKKMEADLNMHYLSPGAFTVLPLDVERLPDPPPAPPPYRLPVNSKRYKHAAFAIVGEATPSNPNSRSSSPTGRVSPFRGHGFNPSGSKHVSPSSSPVPPADSQKILRHPSKIPKPNGPGNPRKTSTGALFGEKVSHTVTLNRQSSQSMTNLEDKDSRGRPPPSPRKRLKGAFKQLSPIQGSSPEPSQSSPGAKSRSTPPSRFTSPSRQPVKVPSRSRSRPNIVTSPEQQVAMSSPSKTPRHNKYSHVRAKIDSHNKLPLRPKNESSDLSEDSESPKKVKAPSRRNSLNRTGSRVDVLRNSKTNNVNYTSDSSVSDTTNRSKVAKKPTPSVSPSRTKSPPKTESPKKEPIQRKPSYKNNKQSGKETTSDEATTSSTPSALDVVSSTTNTVTKPLKIETPKLPRTKPVSPIIDGRMLSSTSVSQAINKMNDTVLNTQTLIKDSGLINRIPQSTPNPPVNSSETPDEDEAKKPSEPLKTDVTDSKPLNVGEPPAEPVKTIKNTPPSQKKEVIQDKPTATHTPVPTSKTSSPKKEVTTKPPTPITNNHTNHVSSVGLGNAKALEREVQNNMGRLLGSMDSSLGDTPLHKMSVNDRIKEARTVIAADVKPIQINVREKPSDVEVQSGNVGPHFGVSNGINNERPSVSLPPTQQPRQSPPEDQAKEEVPKNRCKRFLGCCVKALTCASCTALSSQCCRKEEGCCQNLKNKLSRRPRDQVRINIEDEDGEQKRGFWQKLSCCKKKKVGDSRSCFSMGKSWSAKRNQGNSIQSQEEERPKCCSRAGCKRFWGAIFCCHCCRKQPELPPSASTRKESMVSNKKKSLTPLSVPPPKENKPKIDASLVEHNSHMKAAIPVLPIWLAWFCCVMNCIGPGTGTVLSGLFCLCIGKPRFSQNDGPKPRIGAFIIDLIIGFSQFFTVLFCLVGWGWSIWWGVIMVKIAKKHKKLKHLEKLEDAAAKPHSLAGQPKRDAERGRT